MDFCPHCGTGVLDGMKRCPECKRPVSTARKSGMAEELPAPEGKKQAGVFDEDAPKRKRRSVVIKKDAVSIKRWLKIAIAVAVIASAIFSNVFDEEDANSSEEIESPAISITDEQNFFDCSEAGESVYADIVSIFPAYKIYEEENVYTHFACECVSASGDTLWLYITISDYVAFFDSEAWDTIHSDYADEISFPTRRIYGFTQYADDLIDDFSKDIGSELYIEFVSAD